MSQYHQLAPLDSDGRGTGFTLKEFATGIRPITEGVTISERLVGCQHACPFLLDQQALLPYNGIEP
jgi:hypothetical protein